MSLVRPILEYGASCWDTYRGGQINALDRVEKKAAKFASHANISVWETLAHRRKIDHICALFKGYVFLFSILFILCFRIVFVFFVYFFPFVLSLSYYCTSLPTTSTGWKPYCSK